MSWDTCNILSKFHHTHVVQMIWQQSWLELPVWEIRGTHWYVLWEECNLEWVIALPTTTLRLTSNEQAGTRCTLPWKTTIKVWQATGSHVKATIVLFETTGRPILTLLCYDSQSLRWRFFFFHFVALCHINDILNVQWVLSMCVIH